MSSNERHVSKYNVIEKRYELVPESWELQYNVISGTWEYAPTGSQPVHNVVSGNFEMRRAGRGMDARLNRVTGKYEMAGPDWTEQYDPIEGTWRLLPPAGRNR